MKSIVSRSARGLFAFLAFAALSLSLFGCAGGGNTQATEENPFTVEGVYHSSTGMDEPENYAGTPDYDIAKQNEKQNEASADTKHLFVVVNLDADDKENISVTGVRSGSQVWSGAELKIDDTNEYNDNWSLNNSSKFKEIYVSKLTELGYGDGTNHKTLYGGSDDSYKAIFVFNISNNDFENGEVGHLSWNDYSADFNLSDVKEVESPLVMVEELSQGN